MIVVFGTPGAGKTTIIKASGIPSINFGDVMLEMARERFGIKDRDEMRKKISPDDYKRLQMDTASEISRRNPIILDTHASIKMPGGYLPGLPKYILDRLNVHGFVYIRASPREIVQRRIKDGRNRDAETEEEITMHEQINLGMASAYAFYAGVPLKVLDNPDGRLEDTVDRFKKVLSWFGFI